LSQTFKDTGGTCQDLKIDTEDDFDNGKVYLDITFPGSINTNTQITYDPEIVIQEGQLSGGFPLIALIMILLVLILCFIGCCVYFCCCRKKKGKRGGNNQAKPADLA